MFIKFFKKKVGLLLTGAAALLILLSGFPSSPNAMMAMGAFNTFLGGAASDNGRAMVTDSAGNIIVAGISNASWGTPLNSFGCVSFSKKGFLR